MSLCPALYPFRNRTQTRHVHLSTLYLPATRGSAVHTKSLSIYLGGRVSFPYSQPRHFVNQFDFYTLPLEASI